MDDKVCLICKDDLVLPHKLPCNHIFCYICIKRHLTFRNFCPFCYKFPFHTTDLEKLDSNVVNTTLPNIKIPLFKHMNEVLLKKELKKYMLNQDGGYQQMLWRMKEFHLIYSAEKMKTKSLSLTGIARVVSKNEKIFFHKKNDHNCPQFLEKQNRSIQKLKDIIKNSKNSHTRESNL
ncbi:hypothetical protein CWI37_0678p0010 [Hamiltosporidium tvaerminnensis]|uniref:RING-type domain-containing protein n=2 Tax=Hamiltosporidium TaxID=1176354 RepID=A0A4Q9KZU4_9MICR|nr:RING finger and transmembrane domain-containing protein 2 [Hamiltosporidium tvaerminnensis]TBU00205.1 hypothetical protein CWI39_1758p0020 [Hamiltosporidium magnivora]TBU01569.1 hypothetical protein CWI37_0678p0010 [Hamiltosporidium tvaerminnensis]TBU07557.1 hypothetical protein CWI36_0258p0020 [Hamiltosporidium magnivora]